MSGYELLRYLSTTVGLIAAKNGNRTNVMAAEWTTFVARDPLHIAVGMQKTNYTHELILEHGEFSVTLCDESQAALASFCGNVSGRTVDKAASALLTFGSPNTLTTPHVVGGVMNAECAVMQVVDLPQYSLIIGHAIWFQVDEAAAQKPLIKHGKMFSLGPELRDSQIYVGGMVRTPGVIVVAAVAYAGTVTPERWVVRVSAAESILVEATFDAIREFEADFHYDPMRVVEDAELLVEVTSDSGSVGAAKVSAQPSAKRSSGVRR